MLILIEWHKNISVQTVACIVKHEGPQINSVRGVFNKFAVRWKTVFNAVVIWQIYSIDEYTESLKL